MHDSSDQSRTESDLLKWAREHAPELVGIIENPASEIPDSTVPSDGLLTALWFWENNSQNTRFINDQRAKRLADYYSASGDAERLARMRANFEVDRSRADRFAKRRPTKKEVLHGLIRMSVTSYKQTADPDNFEGDIEPEERKDLIKGSHLKTDLREKWAVRRAAERFKRDERTIREAIKTLSSVTG